MRITLIFAAGLAVGLALQTAIGQGYNRGLIAVNHVGLTVPDVDQAVAYYSDTLGFQEAFRANDDNGNARLVYMQVSQDTFVEINRANGRPTGINHFGIHVEDVEAAAAMFASAGAEVTEVRHSEHGRDPGQRHGLERHSYRARGAAARIRSPSGDRSLAVT